MGVTSIRAPAVGLSVAPFKRALSVGMSVRPLDAAIAALALGLVFVSVAASAPASPATGLYGDWTLKTQDGRQPCSLRLNAQHQIRLGHVCGDAFALQPVSSWTLYDGLIVLQSKTGAPVVTFEETESGAFVSEGDPAYVLRKTPG